jgi:hypothetical protein
VPTGCSSWCQRARLPANRTCGSFSKGMGMGAATSTVQLQAGSCCGAVRPSGERAPHCSADCLVAYQRIPTNWGRVIMTISSMLSHEQIGYQRSIRRRGNHGCRFQSHNFKLELPPSGSLQKVSDRSFILLFWILSWRKGSFIALLSLKCRRRTKHAV